MGRARSGLARPQGPAPYQEAHEARARNRGGAAPRPQDGHASPGGRERAARRAAHRHRGPAARHPPSVRSDPRRGVLARGSGEDTPPQRKHGEESNDRSAEKAARGGQRLFRLYQRPEGAETMMHNLKLEPRGDDLDAVELELISQYICHEMTPAEEQAFERRLADDEGFYDRVFPLLDAWYDTDSWPIEAAVVEPAVRPVATIGRGWTRRAGKTSTPVAAAGSVGAAGLRAAPPIGVGARGLPGRPDSA